MWLAGHFEITKRIRLNLAGLLCLAVIPCCPAFAAPDAKSGLNQPPGQAQQSRSGPAGSGKPAETPAGTTGLNSEKATPVEVSGLKPREPESNKPAGAKADKLSTGAPAAKPAAGEAPARRHKVQMRLSGSSCLACLKELEMKLKALDGIYNVKIDFPGDNLYDALPGMAWAQGTITYDPARINLATITTMSKNLGYHPYRIVDKEI